MTEEQKYLLENGCDDLVLNQQSKPEDWIYVSDIMQKWKDKQLLIQRVSQQRELLKACFLALDEVNRDNASITDEDGFIDDIIRDFNCG